jgi:TP901 family phage tail tape measure protein
MTAIWNNFADGSKTLEYYADAMTKLGAETAASTSEIANSLEKFAAIAETVGLSYETAMASVATVIDKTRQSADVVGTAFKTIFARIQGLSMDGVTDDGVSLNKYSAALEKVGVDVLTASGELRDMDEILNDLGAKWQLLGRESQVAVAQVVGGARQYNQLLSLMDNWSEVQSNILKAEGSTGEISKQANIWAESYEAAAKRVEEAKARVSENFLNSEDVVNLTNAFADLITWTDSFIESVGGIIPLGLTIVGLFSKKLIPIFKTGFTTLKENFSTFIGNGER